MDFPINTYPFAPGGEKSRLTEQELKQIFKKTTGAALVKGFAKISNIGGAAVGTERIAGFMETHIKTEYLINLNADEPLIFQTDIVDTGGAPHTAFIFSMGFGNGSPLPQPSGKFDIYVNGVFCLSVRKVNFSYYWRDAGTGSEFAFSMRRSETAAPYASLKLSGLIENEGQAAFGIGLLKVNSCILRDGEPAEIKIIPAGEYKSARYFYLSDCPGIITGSNLKESILTLASKNIKKSGAYNIYFGDIHTHSGQLRDKTDGSVTCGMNSMEDNYKYAQGPGGLHFYALTDHEFQVLPDYEKQYFDLADKFNKNGEFICLKAYEHTSPVYGHRNIYFKDNAKIIAAYATDNNGNAVAGPATTPGGLFAGLTGYEFFSIPHHTSSASHPFNIDLITDKDVCCEIYSSWGSSEYGGDFPRGVSDRHGSLSVSEIFRRNLKLGILAGSDGHDGHPGDAQSPLVKHPHLFHFCGSGLTAVLCEELTRENIYEAIKNRRCYATTGPPIALDYNINGAVMGSVINSGKNNKSKPRLYVKCGGTSALKELRVVKNGRIIHTENCAGLWEYETLFEDNNFIPGEKANYYIRIIQNDMESAWSSPVFFD